MNPGWYILNYHDISWEKGAYTRAIGGNLPPDIFRSHLDALRQTARLVSIPDGFRRFHEGKIDEPLVSIWFDDGLAGVRKYALPLMEQLGVKGAMSVNSQFMLRQELFWRFKLSFLTFTDGMRFLRSKLRPLGFKTNMSVRSFTLDHFTPEIVADIDEVYRNFTDEFIRQDAFRLFDNVNGIAELHRQGWEIANHSASHYPVSEDSYIEHFDAEFGRCEAALQQHFDLNTRFWVIPFDRKGKRSPNLQKAFKQTDDRDRTLVLVGHRFNTSQQQQGKQLFRIYPPYEDGAGLIRFLNQIQPAV
jgi:peptidoglycan/xylan/chitin deacetylase (PgdA/CDA1 family)